MQTVNSIWNRYDESKQIPARLFREPLYARKCETGAMGFMKERDPGETPGPYGRLGEAEKGEYDELCVW